MHWALCTTATRTERCLCTTSQTQNRSSGCVEPAVGRRMSPAWLTWAIGTARARLAWGLRDQVGRWVKELRKIVGPDISIVIAGNKSDLEKQRNVDHDEAVKCVLAAAVPAQPGA